MFRIQSGVVAVLLVAGCAGTVLGQTSLGELARQEEARRGAVKRPSRVYTNADLGGDASTSAGVETGRAAPPAAPAQQPAGAPKASPSDARKDDRTDEKTWRGRIAQARDQLARSRMFLEALQSRVNGLSADFAARDDPAQRASIATDRQKALAELERVRRDIEQQTSAIADIQEEARRAGIPPGWVR